MKKMKAESLRKWRTAASGCLAAFLLGTTAISAASPLTTISPVLVHTFSDDGKPVGYLIGYPEPNTEDAYSHLEIRSMPLDAYRVLYRIERTGLFLGSGQLDAAVHDDGSRGFFVTVQRPGYVTIECCRIRNPNNGATDPITIEWVASERQFRLSKAP